MQSSLQTYRLPVHALSMYKYSDEPRNIPLNWQIQVEDSCVFSTERSLLKKIYWLQFVLSFIWWSAEVQRNMGQCVMLLRGALESLPQGGRVAVQGRCRGLSMYVQKGWNSPQCVLLKESNIVFCWCAQLIIRQSCGCYSDYIIVTIVMQNMASCI